MFKKLFKKFFNKNKNLKNLKFRLYGEPKVGRWRVIMPNDNANN